MSTIRKTSSSPSGTGAPNPYASAMFASLPAREFDDHAFTQEDIAKTAGISYSHCARLISARVESGEWEQVWKRLGNRSVRAYRPAK
jgi:hypothetical protein